MRSRYLLVPALTILALCSLNSSSKSSGGGYVSTLPSVTTPTVAVLLETDSHFGSIKTYRNGCLSVWPVTCSARPARGTGIRNDAIWPIGQISPIQGVTSILDKLIKDAKWPAKAQAIGYSIIV